MAEIKLNDGFDAEVEAFRASGEAINSSNFNSISIGNVSLPTVNEYQARLFKIRNVILRFKLLVRKDSADMDALATLFRTADSAGG